MNRISFAVMILLALNACKYKPAFTKIQSPEFISFIKNFDTVPIPFVISNPNFLKESSNLSQQLKVIDPKDMYAFMKMDSLIPYPVFYFGQLPMKDSMYYLINYFEIDNKHNPSRWWTLMKFDYFGSLISETNISYCVKDSNEVRERFCKIMPNYQCFYLETTGLWDEKKRTVTDTVLNTKTINLTYDQNR